MARNARNPPSARAVVCALGRQARRPPERVLVSWRYGPPPSGRRDTRETQVLGETASGTKPPDVDLGQALWNSQ